MQQLAQGLFGREVAIHRRGLLASNHIGAEEHLQRGLLAQLAQGCAQGLGTNVDALGSLCSTDDNGQGQGRPAGNFIVVEGKFFHVEPSPVIASMRGR